MVKTRFSRLTRVLPLLLSFHHDANVFYTIYVVAYYHCFVCVCFLVLFSFISFALAPLCLSIDIF